MHTYTQTHTQATVVAYCNSKQRKGLSLPFTFQFSEKKQDIKTEKESILNLYDFLPKKPTAILLSKIRTKSNKVTSYIEK